MKVQVGFQVIERQVYVLPTTKFLLSAFDVQREEKLQMHMFSKGLKGLEGLIIYRDSHTPEFMAAIVSL